MSPAAPAGWGAASSPAWPRPGHHVISVDRDAVPAAQLPAGVEQETADLLAPGEARRLIRETTPDAVIHLAAIAVPFSAPEDVIFSTNTRLAFAVVSAATELGIGKIITASSPTVLGYGSPAGWLPEGSRWTRKPRRSPGTPMPCPS